MTCKTIMIFSLFISLMSPAWAAETSSGNGCETAISCTVNTGTPTTTEAVQNQTSGITTTTTNYADGTAGEAGSGVYTQAQNGKNQSMIMGVVAVGLGVRYASRCGSRNPRACMLAAAAFSAAGVAASQARKSQDLMNTLGTNGSTVGTADTPSPNDTALIRDLNKLKADLATQGYTVDEHGNITTPSGSTVNGDLSEQSLQASGMSAQDAAALQKDLAAMRKELNAEAGAGAGKMLAQGSGSTGYGRVSISSLDGEGNLEAKAATEAERSGIDRDPAAWAGFFKQHGNGVIGVGHADIFLMVEKRVGIERNGMGQ